MIRVLVFALLALNLLYFSWARMFERAHPQLVAASRVPTQPVAAATATPPPCTTFGPFSDQPLALRVKGKLEAGGLHLLQREASETVREGWWVHVDNADANQQARTLNTVHSAGLRDATAISDDPAFPVAVGIFSAEERAQERAARMRKLKLEPVVSERLREQVVIWLDVPGVARATLEDGHLAMAGATLENLRIEACPSAAPIAPDAAATAIIPAP